MDRPPSPADDGTDPLERAGVQASACCGAEAPEAIAEKVDGSRDADRERLRSDLRCVQDVDEHPQDREVHQERAARDHEERGGLEPGGDRPRRERPMPVPPEVVGEGDQEGTDRRDSVVEPSAMDSTREDPEVDGVATGAHDEEAGELEPVRGSPHAAGDAQSDLRGRVQRDCRVPCLRRRRPVP